MIYVFYIFAALQLFLSYKSLRSGIEYRRYFKHQLAAPLSEYSPFVTVIAPCKGRESGLRRNLEPLFYQNYPSYEVIFVVDDADDPAIAIIEELTRNATIASKLVVAPRATSSGQKVENLREAILHADVASQVFVFVDSDVRPDENWLRSLVAPLDETAIGAATGYRWFIAEKFSLASELRSVWNASIASALGPTTGSNFCWGGSTAIRRETFEKLGIRDKWNGTLSDDFSLTRALKDGGLPIHFVPRCIVPSFGECSALGLIEFTNRQMKITRVYSSKLWAQSFLGSALYAVFIIWALFNLFSAASQTFERIISFAAIALVLAMGTAKSVIRLSAIGLVLKERGRLLRRQRISHLTLWVLTPFIFLLNSAVALFSRRVRWRGITYEMISATVTQVLERR